MQAAKDKLQKHRERALKKGDTPASYADVLGIAPQRISRLISDKNTAPPTLEEAMKIQAACRIKPSLWLADN